MNKVDYVHLRDLCTVNQGLQIPIEQRFLEPGENRFFYITVQFLKDGHLEKFYIENPPKSTICYDDDLIIVRTGSTGQVLTGIKGCFHNNFFKVNYNKELLNHKYLYYCLTSKEKQKEMLKRSGITTIPDLNHFMFLDIKIPYQNLPTQQKIASVLSALDDKIEVNNKINATLEAIAKTLYDYWFVQFDFPNTEGKPYKSSGGKMVYNPTLKREIPEGWEVKELGSISKLFAGGDKPKLISSKKCEEFIYPIYSNSISDYGIYGFGNSPKVLEPSITITARGTIGHIELRKEPFIPIIRLISLTPNKKNQELFFYHSLKNLVFENSGSVQKQLTIPQISKLKVLYPNELIIESYFNKTNSIINKIENIKNQNQELAQLRDWLLPMLMNGQVSVE